MQSSQDMKLFVSNLLIEKLPSFYYYHNAAHTLYVMEKAAEIGHHENCTEKEIDLLSVAALWHDAGFINTYSNHEKESCLLARQYLPAYGYPADEIAIICGMIMATKMPQSPKTRLEAIVADADLEYLGTQYAGERADALYRELQHLNPSLTQKQWLKNQVTFLQNHQYFTSFCKKNRDPAKQAYLQRLQDSTD